MKKNYKNKFLGMSAAAAMLLGSSAYAGKIIGATVGDPVVKNTQYGFGGWNLDSVVVNITSDSNFSDIIYGGIEFEMLATDGTYPEMNDTMSFESIITTEGEIRGLLHGKDWPVGEPAGIKVINGDKVNHGKPGNCIMTTSYLETTYLDANNPEPVICTSDFQTHKRFKINLQPTTVTGIVSGEGHPIDLVFNLDMTDPNPDSVRYQVFSKINNYTGMRLNGYKVEVLNGNGIADENLTLSIGIGEGDADNDGVIDGDIWDVNELANFAHGLWGPIDKHFPEIGFFDDNRSYYPTAINELNNTITGTGPLAGGNYVELFGDWIHSGWAPQGIFFDHDNNPDTDAELMAFWGVPPGTNLPIGWYKGMADEWAPVDEVTLLSWARNPLYNMGAIEDVLNLGLNYIVNVGPNAQIPGGKFIIRITPSVDTNQTEPIHMSVAPSLPTFDSKGGIVIVPEPTFEIGTTLTIAVSDADLNVDSNAEDNVTITLTSTNISGEVELLLTETGVDTSLFFGTLVTSLEGAGDNDISTVLAGTTITATYLDDNNGTDTNVTVSASTTAAADIVPVTDPVLDPSSGGGGCTYNPNSKHFDMMFLVMMALGLLYPFRRRFLK